MEYRRFGKTEKKISVITLGGMRFLHGWDSPRDELPEDSVRNCYEITQKAFDLGINHVETAYGYTKSEGLYGRVLPQLKKREDYFLMTKGSAENPDHFKGLIEGQLQVLNTSYFDFYAYHGINNHQIYDHVMDNKLISVLENYKRQGIIKHIGFSTHAPLEVILDTINTDLFDFVNLHYYYFNQRNREAVKLAASKDMGILIISPNDKGGQLWNSPERVIQACAPLHPAAFNGRFCLSHEEITTLTMGFHEDHHFDNPMTILNNEKYGPGDPSYIKAKERMDSLRNDPGIPYCTLCHQCLPCPEGINIPEVLRMWDMDQFYDMGHFGRYRYNMFQPDNHWFPGCTADRCTECGDCLPRCPEKLPIISLLKKTHQAFYLPSSS